MKLSVERLPESRVSLDIAADETEFTRAVEKAARRVGNQAVVPGFRKGKAPRAMIERLYGREVFIEEANRTLMSDLYRQAMTQEDLVPVGEPEVEIISADPLAFKVTTAIYPSVDPGSYQEVRVDPVDATLDEAELDSVIEDLRKDNSPWVDPAGEGLEVGADMVLQPKPRLPRAGDQITIDVQSQTIGDDEATTEENDAVFILGESGMLDELEAAIKTLRIGESATVQISFGEDEERANAEVRGKTIAYTITLNGLKERDLLPLDDELARTASEFDTLDELRENVRGKLHREKTERVTAEAYQQVIDKILERAVIELPAAMVDEAVHNDLHELEHRLSRQGVALEAYLRMSEQSQAELEAELRPMAAKRLRTTLVLQDLAEREELTVSNEQMVSSLSILASPYMTGSEERSRALLRDQSFIGGLRQQLLDTKVRQRLIEIATEGRGAVINGWVAPEPEVAEPDEADTADEIEATPAAAGEAGTEPAAIDEALTIGTMPGQPGDLAETTPAAEQAEPAAAGDEEATVAAAEPDDESGGAAAHPTI
ncbi:MAG: trigger factor [Chloroflexota bacterium]|nr:trigger factor [Chloroflexota bacterium]